jgi:hypothetical protein
MSPERQVVRLFRRKFHALRSHAFHAERTCACGEPVRPKGKDCHTCHAVAQRAYRARQRLQRAANDPLARLAAKHAGDLRDA